MKQGRIAHVPTEVAARLRGKTYKRFSDFQTAFWKAVGEEPHLLAQFSKSNQKEILKGNAPFAPSNLQIGKADAHMRYNLHHKKAIEAGGGVYDIDNILVASPLDHFRGMHD